MPKIKSRSKKGRLLGKRREKKPSKKEIGVQRNPSEGVKGVPQDSQVYQMKLEMQYAYASEITQRKQVEEALRNSEIRVRQSSQLVMAHEGERRRLSQKLDTSILFKLFTIKSALEKKISLLGKELSPERSELENLILIAQHTMEDTRRIMTNLYPSILEDLGLVAGINLFLGEFQKMYSHVQINNQVGMQEIDVPESLRLVIFRVLQEALDNFIKHGQGDQVYIALKKKGEGLKLVIEDNGIGFNPENCQNGLGLESMKGRVELSGGVFMIESARGKGTTIRASWPC